MSAKLAKYDRLYEQIKGYVQTTDDIWARLATMEAVLHHKMQTFFWTGVYALIDDELIVRSYQGPVACQKLPIRDREGRVFACLDVDSDRLDAFDREDEEGLKKILSLLFD